ncbi:MAG: site-specific integrase [Rubrivivax sp.]|nr:MAG: site-specific integrase [Rubrivivax sp.]
MSDSSHAKLYTLPVLRLTKVSDAPGPRCLPIQHRHKSHTVKYWREQEIDNRARWKSFPKFPLVLNADGSPWAPACLYLLEKALLKPQAMSSLTSLAQGLKDYRNFLHGYELEWDDFSAVDKYLRPTYLYKTFLQDQIHAGLLKPSTASRRVSTVMSFYRFLMSSTRMQFAPANEPWEETKGSFAYRDARGFKQVVEVAKTNLAIRVPKSDYAFDETIRDGGKLRPLTIEEQRQLIAALKVLGNPEYELMHYITLLTGARKQTVLTLRVEHFLPSPSDIKSWPLKLRCGPGTGIDTKLDRSGVHLVISQHLYTKLHVYVKSERAQHRRRKSRWGDDPHNYVFLTQHGNPYYEAKEDIHAEREFTAMLRSSKTAQGLFQFIKNEVIPEVRKCNPTFNYKFHDLRATFGLNWVDHVLGEDGAKEKYLWAREQLRKLMWHKDATTTDRYLEYRHHLHHLKKAQEGWNQHLLDLIA